MKTLKSRKFIFLVAISWWLFLGVPPLLHFPSAIKEAQAAIYTPVSNVNPGWSNNRQNLVFYNGSRFFLLYSRGDSNIYYKSSTDNVTWTNESTLITNAGSNFNIYLVNDGKFDLVYDSTYMRTCTISGETITPGNASLVENISHSALAVARSGSGDRIYFVGQFNDDFLRIYSNDNTGDATSTTTWWRELEDSTAGRAVADTIYISISPYQNADKVLVVYTKDLGGTASDGVYSREVAYRNLGSEAQVGDFNTFPKFSTPIRISDTDFRIIIKNPNSGGAMEEWKWNGTSWSQVAIFDSDETDQSTPSLFYDRITGDMYAFAVDTGSGNVECYYKPTGGSWQTEVLADECEAVARSLPITQMHEPPLGSTRETPRKFVWAYRVANGSNYDLKVGTLGLTDCYFKYRKPIKVQSNQVQGGPHTDFPMLVSLTDADLKTKAYGGKVASYDACTKDPRDIIFRALDDSTCNVQGGGSSPCTLSHEIEKYTPSTGELVVWVKVPKLYYNSDSDRTVIYIYYGNDCIASSTQDPTGVWDSYYKGVWHLKETPDSDGGTYEIKDSTGSHNGSSTNMEAGDQGQTTAKIDGNLTFDGLNEYVAIPDHADWTLDALLDQDWTLQGWFNFSTLPVMGQWDTVLGASSGGEWAFQFCNDGSLKLNWYDGNIDHLSGAISINTGEWHHYVLTLDFGVTNGSHWYLDGVDKGSFTAAKVSQNPSSVAVGWVPSYDNTYFTGALDEVRLYNGIRANPADWIKTEYNNQISPSAFYSIEPEETSPKTAVDLFSFTARGQGGSVLVEWQTAQEVSNLGFNLYRLGGTNGSFIKLNTDLIPGLVSSVKGRRYSFTDSGVIRGALYFYMLEDIDLSGKATMHDPVCVDWDDDGIADDQEKKVSDDEKDKEDTSGSSSEEDQSPADWTPSPGESASWVKVSNFRARQEADGVSLEWMTSFEIDNLGFNVYREQEGRYYRITTDLVPGSVFSAGNGRKLPVGQRYIYFDALSALTGQESYWLDCVGFDGARASFGPIKPEIGGKPIPERLKARFQSIAKHQFSREEKLEKIIELRKELRTKETEMQASRSLFSSQAIISSFVPKPSEPRLPPNEAQWVLAAKPAVKISVKEEGWYKVGQPELVAAGLDPLLDPRYLQLYVNGEEQSMMVTGSNDGMFDPEDSVEFYGKGLDTPYTDTRVYWLVVGTRPGRRLDTPSTDIRMGLDLKMLLSRGLRGRGAPLSFPYTVELKERTFYFAALKNGEEESFFGSILYTEPVDQLINVPHPDPSAPDNGKLEIALQGATESSHQVKILFNNQEAGLFTFSGQQRDTIEIEIPHGLILDGENIVTLEAQGGDEDVSLVDYIRLTYWRTYTADDDSLKFMAMGTEWISVGGFSTEDIRVVDITDPSQMFEVRGKVVSEGSGYAITVKVPGHGQRTLLAFTEEKIKEPAVVAANIASSWHEITQGADVVLISSKDFLDSLRPLKELREQQGLAVVVVDVEDLYDEFNFGSKSPWPLRDFLNRAYDRWVPAPRFVLFVGDASYDPRNYLGFGDFDFVPTKFVETEYIKTASDDWFVDFDDDGAPNMAVGRLPVDIIEEAEAVVSKIISYESAAGFMNEVLLVADANDYPYDFEASSAEVAALLPQGMTVRQILRGQNPAARTDLLALLNQGQLVVNYIGHGSTEIWKGNLLTSSDAWELTNSPYLPFLVSMTCLNGFFQDPSLESMAETFLKAQRGGAVAVWASSGLTSPPEQLPPDLKLIQLLFSGQGLTIGEAVVLSKQAVNYMDVRKTWILFGDPAIKLR